MSSQYPSWIRFCCEGLGRDLFRHEFPAAIDVRHIRDTCNPLVLVLGIVHRNSAWDLTAFHPPFILLVL